MPLELITDLDDPRIAVFRALKATNQTRGLDQFVVEGEKLVQRLIASRFPAVSLVVTDRFVGQLEANVPLGVPCYVIPFELIHSLVGFPFHRGVLACGRRIPWESMSEIMGRCGPRSTLVVCPKISDPENLGAIVRIGDVFGIDAILAGPSCPDPLSRRVLRVSMGSVLRLPVIVSDRLQDEAQRLISDHGVALWAAVAEPLATSFEASPRPDRLALVLGDEDEGVDSDWLRLCVRSITIPMRTGASSLNVSVAAGILLYHLTRSAGKTAKLPTAPALLADRSGFMSQQPGRDPAEDG
jgi:tRNA G18 (ribose-2'-O)-methylase SpoU